MHLPQRSPGLLALLAVTLTVAACGPGATPTPLPDVGEVVDRANEAMAQVQSYAQSIEITSVQDGERSTATATVEWQAPGNFKIGQVLVPGEPPFEAVYIDGRAFSKGLSLGPDGDVWSESDPDYVLAQEASFYDPDQLVLDLCDPVLTVDESTGNKTLFRIAGHDPLGPDADDSECPAVTDLAVSMLIDAETFLLDSVESSSAPQGGFSTEFLTAFSRYNEPMAIEVPPLGAEASDIGE